MKATWAASLCALALALAVSASAQSSESGSQNDQSPVLKTRPKDSSNVPQTPPDTAPPQPIGQAYAAAPNAIPWRIASFGLSSQTIFLNAASPFILANLISFAKISI